ncbi:unnamed protein product [Choristocarpus tenellus]
MISSLNFCIYHSSSLKMYVCMYVFPHYVFIKYLLCEISFCFLLPVQVLLFPSLLPPLTYFLQKHVYGGVIKSEANGAELEKKMHFVGCGVGHCVLEWKAQLIEVAVGWLGSLCNNCMFKCNAHWGLESACVSLQNVTMGMRSTLIFSFKRITWWFCTGLM